MGNSACLLASATQGISDAELNRLREQDELCLSLLQQQLPQSEVGKFAGLDGYKVLGASAVPKGSAKPEAQELALLCLQDNVKLADKFTDVRTALQNEIKYIGAKEPSAERRYKNSRLQVLCRIYDAFLRQEERERRRVEASKQSDEKKEAKAKSSLPPLAKAGLGFGMEVLLRLVEAVGGRDPAVLSGTIDVAASVMTELKPMSLATIEPGLQRSVNSFSNFFERIIGGAIPGLDKTTEFKAVTVLLGMALAKGDYTAALSLVQKFITVSPCEEWSAAVPALAPMLQNMTGLSSSKGIWWNWNPERQGPDIAISNENLTITRTNSSGWGNQKSEQTITDGVYYVEMKVDRNSSSCLCIGVCATSVTDYSNKCSFANCICYQADGDTYKNGSGSGNIGSYTAGDRIGMLIDMEEHKLTFYKNGTKMSRDAFDQIPNEVQLIICFGGSDQLVSITNEAEPPADISGMVSASKKKMEEEAPKTDILFAVKPDDVIQDASFSAFTKLEGSAEPVAAATFILASLVKISDNCFSAFNLDSLEAKYPKTVKLQKSNGLVVDVKPKTFNLLTEILEKLRGTMEARSWSEVAFKHISWAALSALRLLRNHIFTAIMTSMSEEESGLTADMKARIKAILKFFSTLSLGNIGVEETPEAAEARNALDHEALLVTLHSFELFFPTLNSQLEFVLTTLSSETADNAEKKLASDLLKKLSQPAMLFRAFNCTSEEDRNRVKAFIEMVVNLALAETEKLLEEQDIGTSEATQSLFVTQSVLFGQVAKREFDASYMALARFYLEKVFAGVQRLIEKLKTIAPEGELSDELEAKVKKTLLDRLAITLLRTLTVLQFDSDFSAYLITEMTRLAGLMSFFKGGKTELTVGTSISTQEYESEHPYPNSADQTHSVVVPGAMFYTLTFDNECKTESGYDYLQLWNNSTKSTELYKWHGNRDQFPSAPLVVKQPELFFTFHSDGGTNYWGWKIIIEATVEVTISKEGWVDELQNSVSALLVALCKNLTAVESCAAKQPVHLALDNQLLRSGVSDPGLFLVSHSRPLVIKTLAELIATTQTEESLPTKSSAVGLLKLGVMKSLLQKKVDSKPSLSAYLSRLGTVDQVLYKYCDIPIIDELIRGSERTIGAFEGLKEQARMTGPLANLGGSDMDQAERALFGVFLAFFELANSFASLADEPQEMGDMFKFILRQAGQIRPWAQLHRQQLIEASNKEITYADLGKDVVEKCVLLLHSDYKHTIHDIGIDKVLESLMTTIQRTQSIESEDRGVRPGSRWKAVKKSVVTLSRMKTLQGLRVLRRAEDEAAGQEEDKKQFLNIQKLVMEFLSTSVTSAELSEELSKRRNKASARCIGLNLMSMAFKAAPEANKGELQGLISTAFADSFSVEGAKRHYSVGTEGIDPYLSSCLQRSFFQLYQLLLNRLRVSAIRDRDCTSETVTQYMMSTFDALSFPFSENDATHLLDLNIREPAQFLLSWAKGQNFFEKLNMKFDRSKAIVDFTLIPESEFRATEGIEAFSLNLKNRLAGEVAEEVEGQQKLALCIVRGSVNAELNPITSIIVADPAEPIEGMTKMDGNINELGTPERALFYSRSEPRDGEFFLKKVTVSGWAPIDLSGESDSYSSFLVTDVPPEEAKKRAGRKEVLRRSAWLLFKLLMFSSAGKFNESVGSTRQSRRGKLQQLFAELLMSELKCLSQKPGAEDSLELRKSVSGKSWRTAEVPLIELRVSPMGDWMGKIREDAEEYLIQSPTKPGLDEISLTDVINEYVGTSDPLMKGHLPAEESSDLPEDYKNTDGEIDFFCFLHYVIAHSDSMIGPFWQKYVKTSKLLQSLPKDFNDAQKSLGGGTVSSIINAFVSTMNPNDDDSFLAYLKLFADTEQPGIVHKDAAPKTAPATFFNEDGQLDFFTAFKYVTSHPDQFPQYFRELKMFTRAYDLPSSCSAFYKASLSPSQAEYQSSLLLLLYQCIGSKGMLAVLGAPQTVLELLKHMFFGTLKSSTIAFRIVKELIASEHSPESFEGLWTSLPKAKLRAEYGEESVSSIVLVLLAFIGIKSSVHIKSWKYSFLSLEKIEALAFEATGFLQSLCKNPRWREHIVSKCRDLVARAISCVPCEQGSETTIGAIGFLKSLDGRREMFTHEWSHVELKGAGVSQGVLIKRKRDVSKLKLYCEGDDALHTENAETFVSTVPESKLSLYSQLPEELVSELFGSVVQLVITLEDPVHHKSATSAESRVNNAAVRRLVQTSCMEILASLCDTKHELRFEAVGDFVAKLIEYMNIEDQPNFPPSIYYELRRILYGRHKNTVSTQVKCATTPVVISDEEEAKIIAGYNEEKQILVVTLKSVGLSFVDIKEAMEHGSNDMDAVLKYIEQRNASLNAKVEVTPADNLLLYKLAKSDKNAPNFKDPTGLATCSETAKGHLVISASPEAVSGKKQFVKMFEENIFANLDKAPEELTVLVALGCQGATGAMDFGFQVGDTEVNFDQAFETKLFRLFFRFDGHVTCTDESAGTTTESDNGFNFEEITTTRFGVFLVSSGAVELKGLAVFTGHFTGSPSYWEEEIKEPPAAPGTFVSFKPARCHATTSALVSALGVEYTKAVEMSQRFPELRKAIKVVLTEHVPLTPLTTDYGNYVVDVAVANTAEELPAGFEKAPIYFNRAESTDYEGYAGKFVGLKVSAERAAVFVKGIEIKDENIDILREEKGQGAGLVSVLVIKVTDPQAVEVPAGYVVVGAGEKGYNLTAGSDKIHFLAYRTSFNFRNQPFTDFSQMPTKTSDGGLIDSFDQSGPVAAVEFDTKRISEEVTAMNGQSTVQLQTRLAKLEKSYKKETCFKLVLKLLKRWADCLQDVDRLAVLLESSGKKYALLKPTVSAIFARPELAPLMSSALLEDVLTQLTLPLFAASTGGVAQKSQTFESSHPYENSLDRTGEIRIPGAKKLVFTFDPRCKSENNYDYLQFCKDKDYQQELYKHTGSTWPNFEVDGDCVYWKFHSDGSNNDWGYLFTVSGSVTSGGGANNEDAMARALWVLEELVFNQAVLPSYLHQFLGKELQNVLTLFAHCTTDSSMTLRALFLLKRALETSVEITDDATFIVDLLGREASTQYKIESSKPEKSSLLKDAVGLVLELKDKYNLSLSAEWFVNFYETFCFLKGVDTKDENFQFLLLKQFLEQKGRSLDVVRESAHPYTGGFTSKELYARGASTIQLEFTKDSEVEPDHCMLFSKDHEGLQAILSGSGGSVNTNVEWATSPTGPSIAISNGGKSVTRTDSSGWGTAISNAVFNSGKIKFNFKIDNDGGSSYLYLGVIGVSPPSLSDCTYKDWSHNMWVYKRTGELHRKGFSTENSSWQYNTGDEVSMILDFDDRTVTFFKNGAQIYQLTELAGPVTLSACFGGSGQNLSILSVESATGDLSKLSEMKLAIPGDKFYYHFPANVGYLTHLQTKWNTEKNPLVAFTDENRSFARVAGSGDPSMVMSNTSVKGGRQFLEVEVPTLAAGVLMGFGIGLTDQPLSVAYQSDGVLKKFGESFMVEGYKEGDSIALLLNTAQNELRVFKNGAQLTALPRVVLEEGKEFHWGVSINGAAVVKLRVASPLATSLDLMGRNTAATPTTKFGYKFTARPLYMGKNKLIPFESLGNLQGEWETYIKKQKHLFSKDVCEQLVNYIDEKCSTTDKEPMALTADDITPTPEELIHYSLLEKLPLADIKSIFNLIKDLNNQVKSAMPLISLDLREGSQSMTQVQKAFLHLRGYLFLKNKNKTLKEVISRTNTSEQPQIEINRTRAIRQKERGMVDSQGVSSIFGQIYRHMNKFSNRSLRHSERIYKVNFTGEGSIDAGGPYNEVMSNICEELMSKYLPLFVPCPNGVNNLGENRDAWVPNPSSETPQHMDMFLFLGKLFGVAIRTQNNLNLSLPPIFWKRLIFEEPTTADLKGFDECIFQTLEILRHMDEQGINADNFTSAFDGETFTTRDSSCRLVELCPGGKDMIVTFANAAEYADLLEKQRLFEAADAYAAIRKGMSAVVPMNLIYMFSWKQVETLVCGAADINVDVLKGNTCYEGLSDSSSVVQMFWEVFREMTPKERSLFLRFVWGRSRLPAGKDFKQFKITNKSVSGNVDNYLPVSHTCFFTIDMPPYTNKVTMREKLVYAITHCQAIDLDRVVGAEGWEDE